MSPIRFRDEEPSLGSVLASLAVGALAGFAVGVVVAQKAGGISGITTRIRSRFAELEDEGQEREEYHRQHHDEYGEDELTEEDEEAYGVASSALEEEVLGAFQDDPVLSERAIDIGAIADGVIELSGWVDSEEEAHHAATVARRVPGVESVVNRLAVGEGDDEMHDEDDDDGSVPRDDDDPSEPLPGGQWEGQRVGTGRRRQGNSGEPDRHADPRPELEDHWLDERHALRDAAGEVEGVGERRRRGKKPHREDRTEGGPVAPGGVPKGDHVADPDSARDVNPNT